jgi:hypothetical protein
VPTSYWPRKKVKGHSDCKDKKQRVAADHNCGGHQKQERGNYFASAERWRYPLRKTGLGEFVSGGGRNRKVSGLQQNDQGQHPAQARNSYLLEYVRSFRGFLLLQRVGLDEAMA